MNKVVLVSIFATLLATSIQAANERQTLHGHVPQGLSQLQPVGCLEGSQRLNLALGVAPRDEQGLDTFLQELYDPSSTNFHRYLTPAQFTTRFGPTEQDYQALIDYAKASGLNVTGQHSNRVVLDVEGAVSDIEKALQVTLRTYQHPTEARTFYATDVEPSVPLGIPVLHIAGLNNYMLPHPRHKHHASEAAAKEGSAPGGQLWGNDFRDAYVPGATLTGAGQSIGLVEFEGYYPKDIIAYETAIGMSAAGRPEVVVVPLNGGATPQDGGDNGEECSIDIEISVAMAPGLAKVYVFECGGNPASNAYFDDILESMVSYVDVLQFSCSWGGSTEEDPTAELLFKQMAAQGQSFYDASGDSGAFVGPIEFPSDSPSIAQVGGTTLTDGGTPSYPWESEVVWDWDGGPRVSASDAESSSGGISTYYTIPDWQSQISMSANLGSTTMRNTPDVAANADNCYIYSDDGEATGGFGGTSCAAPLWAGFTALINQQAAAKGMGPVGFLNPTLYTLAASANYHAYFHDIIAGNNIWRESPNAFYATGGYDLCTGLGSMNGMTLIDALVGSATNITKTPSQLSGSLKVTLTPAAAVKAGVTWQVDGGTAQNSGATATNLSVGEHVVSFNSTNGWTAPAQRTIIIKAKTVTAIAGAYTYAAAGIYNGLFMPSEASKETSGMLRGLTVTRVGTYSGTLLIANGAHAVAGTFNASSQASNSIIRSAVAGGPLTLAMTLHWDDSPPNITGAVSGVANGVAWVANLTNELRVSNSPSAEYTALISPGTPPGSGYMLLSSHLGAFTLSGSLADGTAFAQAVPLSGITDLPLYVSLAGGNELLIGWISLASGSPSGNLTWIKQLSRSGTRYASGFTNNVSLQGSPWTDPATSGASLTFTSGQLTLSGGNLPTNLSFTVAVTSNNTLMKLPGSPTNSLTGSINSRTGLLRITFGNGTDRATTTGVGAFLQNTNSGGGYFLGRTNAGSILLQP